MTSRTPQLGQVSRNDTAASVYKFVQRPQAVAAWHGGHTDCASHGDRDAAGAIIDGRAYAAELMEEVTDGVGALDGAVGIATLLVGDDYAAQVYQRRIDRHAHEAGIFSRPERLPARRLARRACSPSWTSSTATRA